MGGGGGRSREGSGEGASLGRGLCPLPRKNEFLHEKGGFWCILGLLFTFMQKLVRSIGGRPPLRPLNPPLQSSTYVASTAELASSHKRLCLYALTSCNVVPISRERNVLETPKFVGSLLTPWATMPTSFKVKGQTSRSHGQ